MTHVVGKPAPSSQHLNQLAVLAVAQNSSGKSWRRTLTLKVLEISLASPGKYWNMEYVGTVAY